MEDYQKRMLDEHSELKDRWTKLNAALAKDDFREKVGDYLTYTDIDRHIYG